MTPFRENLRGILAITACNFLFLINDTQMKLVSSELPLGEIIFIRGILATLFLAPFVALTGAHVHLSLLVDRAFVVRTAAEILAAYFFLVALFHIPIANANTILQVVPLAITAAAAVFFREPVGWRRWTAILIGFAGVLIVIRPGFAGFNAFSLLTLTSVLFITLRDMTTRIMPRGLPALLVAQVTAISVCCTGPIWSLISGEQWVMPSPRALALIAGAAAFLIGGYLTAVVFMRHGDIAVVAPFRYTVIVWAIIVGYLVWGEAPDGVTLLGTAIIIATGVYTFHRESRMAARARLAVGK
jgi:drug/metabolite transporter (DMT)-like permease